MTCPGCGTPLPGLGRWCENCEEYTTDMVGATTDPTPEARERITDTRTEAEIQQAIKTALDMLGYHVHDMSQARPTRQAPGIPDLYVQGHGVTAWVEVKKPGGKVSEHQQGFLEREMANGGNALVAYGDTEAVEYLEGLRRRAS